MWVDDLPVLEQGWSPAERHGLAAEQGAEGLFSLLDKAYLTQRLEELLLQPIRSPQDLEKWIEAEGELSEQIQEMASWVLINFKRDHRNEQARLRFEQLNREILPVLERYGHQLDKKLISSPFVDQLDQKRYGRLLQSRKNALALYREANIPLRIKEQELIKRYNEIIGGLTIDWEGKKRTFQEMQKLLEDPDRRVREKAYRAIWNEVLEKEGELNELMTQLVRLRHQMARNAGFANFRDYIYRQYERYDYTPQDSFTLYQGVKKHVIPLLEKRQQAQRQALGLADYKPWDVAAQGRHVKPLSPFDDVRELVDGTIQIFERVDPLFGHVLREMDRQGLLDLENRQSKSPGGFCSSLPVTGLSFIFMHATGTPRDVVTLIHEGGHAVHNFLMQRQPLAAYRSADKEAAELASMGTELITMDQWSVFYPDPDALKQAQKEHLQKILSFFPWAMVVDQFQHWMYEHPFHTVEERKAKFVELAREMTYHGVDTEGMEDLLAVRWMVQPHIFEVPFYYIEYVIAQLGALELWADYQKDPEGTLTRFKQALALGSSENLPTIYAKAGLHFDLSEGRLQRLVSQLDLALESLEGNELVKGSAPNGKSTNK